MSSVSVTSKNFSPIKFILLLLVSLDDFLFRLDDDDDGMLSPMCHNIIFFSMISIHRKLSLFSLHINYQKKHISAVFILSNSEK